MHKVINPEIHLISGGLSLPEFVPVAASIHSLVDYIHIRYRSASAKELLQAAHLMMTNGVPPGKIIVNDRLDVALASGAGGVQLAGHSLPAGLVRKTAPGLRTGVSVHSPEEASAAAEDGADYCLYGHVYDSGSKPGLPGRGTLALRAVVRASAVPVIAIGGISPGRVREVLEAGASGFAVLSGICGVSDPYAAAQEYRSAADSCVPAGNRQKPDPAGTPLKGGEAG